MVSYVLSALLGIHIVAGSIGLLAFWAPVFSRKGGRRHRRYGRVFAWSAYAVVGSALMAVSVQVLVARMEGVEVANAADEYAFLFFLGYLALVTGIIVRHGLAVLADKRDLRAMNRPLDKGLAASAIAASLALIGFALYYDPGNRIVLLALSPVGITSGYGILRAISGRRTERTPWIHEHLEAMLGAGIAYHTAFAVFGSGRLFDVALDGPLAVVPWVLPAVIGVPAIAIWTRRYRRGPAPKKPSYTEVAA